MALGFPSVRVTARAWSRVIADVGVCRGSAAARRGLLRDSLQIEAGVAACRARAQYVGQNDRTFPILPGEQALNIYLGGPDVMRGQLRRLLDAVDLPGPSLGGGYPGSCSTSEFTWRRILDLRRPQGRGRGMPRGRDDHQPGPCRSVPQGVRGSSTPLPSTVRLPGT
ncbi:Scr1 family TA system antitoxin-like transcriptional regulator [Streptomyces olivaceus]|uniref:Scr1 family TA system antitoxin-like transcriptional regulator n=1 Tax=Streptomyces olivaceus TaxID=47716 RepID=UPI001CCCA18A